MFVNIILNSAEQPADARKTIRFRGTLVEKQWFRGIRDLEQEFHPQ